MRRPSGRRYLLGLFSYESHKESNRGKLSLKRRENANYATFTLFVFINEQWRYDYDN